MKQRFPRPRRHRSASSSSASRDPDRAAEVSPAIDAMFTQLARRDADRDREGVPARLRRDDRGDPGGDPGGVASS
ncbi:MAG: hypothetical protein MZW92_38255 [Comamonadaceae bacterium]|nr:hypothetical protein [Comamonadaceae bacterium]